MDKDRDATGSTLASKPNRMRALTAMPLQSAYRQAIRRATRHLAYHRI